MVGWVDDKAKSQAVVDKYGLTMPFAHSMDAEEMSKATGCYFEPEKKYLHATGFMIKPDGSLYLGAYSSGVVGRITPGDALSIIRYYQTEDRKYLPQI